MKSFVYVGHLISWTTHPGLNVKRLYLSLYAIAHRTLSLSCIEIQLLSHIFHNSFSVRLLSVLRGHSVFSSPPQRPMTSDFEGFAIPYFIHYIYFPILILEKEPVFSLTVLIINSLSYYKLCYVSADTKELDGEELKSIT